ncbi:hypothetical protein ACDX78_01670 [Virgibacillus oceani]
MTPPTIEPVSPPMMPDDTPVSMECGFPKAPKRIPTIEPKNTEKMDMIVKDNGKRNTSNMDITSGIIIEEFIAIVIE